jgi:hypothetical protein
VRPHPETRGTGPRILGIHSRNDSATQPCRTRTSNGLVTLQSSFWMRGWLHAGCVLRPLCSRVAQTERARKPAATLVSAVDDPRSTTDRQIASQHGMCSLDGRCLIERDDNQRLRWSAPVWSPPPESNRRPRPYHGTTRNRCADDRFPRSRPTVGVEVIGSPSTELCVLFSCHAPNIPEQAIFCGEP